MRMSLQLQFLEVQDMQLQICTDKFLNFQINFGNRKMLTMMEARRRTLKLHPGLQYSDDLAHKRFDRPQ